MKNLFLVLLFACLFLVSNHFTNAQSVKNDNSNQDDIILLEGIGVNGIYLGVSKVDDVKRVFGN